MVRNFGQKRKKKNKKLKRKGPPRGKDITKVTGREAAINEPPKQGKVDINYMHYISSSNHMESYGQKKIDQKSPRGDWGSYDYSEEEDDNYYGDYGGYYDEINGTHSEIFDSQQTVPRKTTKTAYFGRRVLNENDSGNNEEDMPELFLELIAINEVLMIP